MKIAVVILLASFATAQGFQITGGSSSLIAATGGQAKVVFPSSETELSGGILNGQFFAGATETLKYRGWGFSGGTLSLPFGVPTDFYPTSSMFPAVGVEAHHNGLTLFAGASASSYQTPFFFGSKPDTPTFGVWWTRTLTPTLTFDTAEVLSGHSATAIQSLTWKPLLPLSISGSAGIGGNSPFAAGRIAWRDAHWNGLLNYTKRAPGFRRVIQPYQTVVEDSGLNVAGGFNSQRLTFNADHTNSVSIIKDVIVNSTINSMSASGRLSIFQANASEFVGTSGGRAVQGTTAGIGGTAGPITAHLDWYSRNAASVTVTERFNRHWSLNQFVTGHAVNLGGAYTSNRLSVSAGESMSFYPALGTFQKVMSISLSVQLPHNTRLDAGTVTTPDGRVRWTAYASTVGVGPLSDIQFGHAASVSGKYQFRGQIVDERGEPVAGAITIGKNEAFGTAKGIVVLPSRKMRTEVLTVVVADFIAPGRWVVVSAPETVTPGTDFTIVVKRAE